MDEWTKNCLYEVFTAFGFVCIGVVLAVLFTAGVEWLADLAGKLIGG